MAPQRRLASTQRCACMRCCCCCGSRGKCCKPIRFFFESRVFVWTDVLRPQQRSCPMGDNSASASVTETGLLELLR
jgi:hypothetical protein